MSLLKPSVASWFSTHHAVADRVQLLTTGASRAQIAYAVEVELLVRESPRVYRLTAAPVTPEQQMAIACAAGPDVLISHHTAGRVWGFRRLGRDERLHVLMAGRSNRAVPDVVVHRSHRIDPVDVVDRGDGIRLTSPVRTVFDLAATLSDDATTSIIEQLLHEQRCTLADLLATAARLREKGRTGSARFGRVLASRPLLLKPVASDLEHRLERAIIAAGLPAPLRQVPIRLPSGETVHPDFYWPDVREAVEVDHVTWHGGLLDSTYDKRRDRQLRRLGVHVTRVTDDDVLHRLDATIADLAAILRPPHRAA